MAPAKKGTKASKAKEVKMNRRDGDRRKQTERRKQDIPVAVERRAVERRAKVNRRRQIDPTTCERDYSEAEVEFMNALDVYKRTSGRMFPTCSEILEVLLNLGYCKAPATEASPAPEAAAEGLSTHDATAQDNPAEVTATSAVTS